MKRLLPHAPMLAALVAVALVALWPLPLGQGAIGHPTGDMPDHYWGTWWFGREILAGHFPIRTDITHYPKAMTLWYVDPVGATVALLLRPLGFLTAWNLLVLLQVLAAGVAGYLAGWDLLRSRFAALFTGVAVMASPYALGLVHSGLAEYLGLVWPVAATWAMVRTLGLDPQGRPPPRHGAVLSGLLLFVCTLQAFYYGAFGVLLAACFLPGPGWKARLRPLVLTGAVYTLLAVPLMVALWGTLKGGDAAVGEHNAPAWEQMELPAVDVLTFFVGGDYRFPDTVAFGNPGILQVNYLGWVLLGLAGWGLWRSAALRRLAVPFGIYGVFALGPRLAVLKNPLSVGGVAVYLPLALLYLPGSPFRMVHHPYRMTAFLLLPLALFAASAVQRLEPKLRAAAVLALLAEALLFSPAKWPLATTPVHTAALPGPALPGPRFDWPADATSWNRSYLLWQVDHGQPIPYGVNVFLDEDLRRDPLVHRLVYAFKDPLGRSRNRDVAFRGRVLIDPDEGETRLAALGFRSFVVHREGLSPVEAQRTRALLVEAFGEPVGESDTEWVWDPQAAPAAALPVRRR